MKRFFGSQVGVGAEELFGGDAGRLPSSGIREFALSASEVEDMGGQAVVHGDVELQYAQPAGDLPETDTPPEQKPPVEIPMSTKALTQRIIREGLIGQRFRKVA